MTDSTADSTTQPTATANGPDPSNADIERLTTALDPNDNVFTLVNPEDPDILVQVPSE